MKNMDSKKFKGNLKKLKKLERENKKGKEGRCENLLV